MNTAPMGDDLFLYGTLRHGALLDLVLGKTVARPQLVPARLDGYVAHSVDHGRYPVLRPGSGAAQGLLALGLSAAARARLDYYELGFGYVNREVTVETDAGPAKALVYLPEHDAAPAEGPWSLADWARDWWPITRHAAAEAMSYFGERSPEEVARIYPMILVRAASRARAEADPTPPGPLGAVASPKLEIIERTRPYGGFFNFMEERLRFRRFDGSMSREVERSGFVGGDAAIVLPYDPKRDRVLLIEQFRTGPHLRGDPQPWITEAIAGRIDAGESPETCARREAREEAGLTLGRLEEVSAHYPSPGAVSEYFFCFVGLTDLPDGAAGIGGKADENEDIRAQVMSYDAFSGMLSRNALRCGPLVLLGLWLQANRPRLRALA